MKCVFCSGTEQLVSVSGVGQVCRRCYPTVKRRQAQPEEVKTVYCENCRSVVLGGGGRCIQCGNHVTSTGEVFRIGGHEDC